MLVWGLSNDHFRANSPLPGKAGRYLQEIRIRGMWKPRSGHQELSSSRATGGSGGGEKKPTKSQQLRNVVVFRQRKGRWTRWLNGIEKRVKDVGQGEEAGNGHTMNSILRPRRNAQESKNPVKDSVWGSAALI